MECQMKIVDMLDITDEKTIVKERKTGKIYSLYLGIDNYKSHRNSRVAFAGFGGDSYFTYRTFKPETNEHDRFRIHMLKLPETSTFDVGGFKQRVSKYLKLFKASRTKHRSRVIFSG
jgi:hypothetical protein